MIYTDGHIALTIYECRYSLWSLKTGKRIHGPYTENYSQELSKDSIEKIKSRTKKLHIGKKLYRTWKSKIMRMF